MIGLNTSRIVDKIKLFKIINETCTYADRDACKEYVYKMYDLACLARKKGLLSFEEFSQNEPCIFTKTALRLAIDGVCRMYIADVLYSLMLADGCTGVELLKKLIIYKGILSVLNGDNPRVIRLELCAVLGEKYIQEIEYDSRN